MKKIYPLLICLFFATSIFSQKEANNWLFGFSSWLDFNNEPPTLIPLPTFNFFAEHNTVSMSDENGNLLFYIDGIQIFDKNHNVMPSGFIDGSIDATHPVFVIPKPGSTNKYIAIINTNGFLGSIIRWIEIDMSLNNGLGDITPGVGENLIGDSVGKTTAIKHSNLEDIWIVGHSNSSEVFFTWLVTSNGINSIPIEIPIGSSLYGVPFSQGQIKTSPSGNKIAVAHQDLNKVEVFDFDRATGLLSNYILLDNLISPYGVEFSPSGKYLYATQFNDLGNQEILQFNLFAGGQTEIANSITSIGNGSFVFTTGGLQLAPNGKIYSSNPGDISLGVINEPNESGTLADYNNAALILEFAESSRGLPSFYHDYLQTLFFSYSGLCAGGITEFSIDGFENTIDSVSWNFGDPGSGANNFSTLLNPTHEYPGTGSYPIILTVYSNSEVYTNEGFVHIAPTEFDFGPDVTVCSNQPVFINPSIPNATYLWSTNETTPFIQVTTEGTYSVEISVGDCPVLSDEITINHIPAPVADLGGDGGLCNGDQVVLDATNPNSTYFWSTGATTPSITVLFGGPYSVTVTNNNGCSDSDEVFYQFDQVIVDPSQANIACFGDSTGVALVFPSSGQLPLSFEWFDGDTLYTHNNLPAGTFSLTITDNLGCTAVQEFTLTQPDEITVNVIVNSDNPSTSNPDGQVLLQPSGGISPYVFNWENLGETQNTLQPGLANGIYNITVTDANDCEKVIAVNVGNVSAAEDLVLLEEIQLFPNPTNELLFLEIPETIHEEMIISISNSLGQKVLEDYFLGKGTRDFRIDVSDWSSGIYFVKITLNGEAKTWKVNVF